MQKLLYCGSFVAAKLSESEIELAKDNWKTLEELITSTRYHLTDTRDSVQVYSSIKVDLSSKVQLGEDIRRAIAESRVKPVKPQRDPMPYVLCVARVACNRFGVFEDNPHLSSPAIKIYTYVYLALMVVFQEITVRRLMGDYREAVVHYEKS